jgi:hypothetical protein
MRTFIFLSLTILSLPCFAAKVICSNPEYKIYLENIGADIRVNYEAYSVFADGLLSKDEVDIVAKFPTIGEMTLFAKINQESPENYLFIKGKRFSIICR